MRQYLRVTYSDRCHISAWLQENISKSEIARRLGFNKSTICRELSRNKSSRGYNPMTADQRARRRYQSCRKSYKLSTELKEVVEKMLTERQWSPVQISERLKLENKFYVSHECIYQFLRKNKEKYRVHLRRLRRRSGCGRHKQKGTHINSFQPNISHRPKEANLRTEQGHVERDIMFASGKVPILVCTDRKTRYTTITLVNNLKSETVNASSLKLFSKFPFKIKTVTSDRGAEFKVPLGVIPTYYCDAQTPQQRGTVENTIGLIRQYIPRNEKVENLSPFYLKEIEDKLNDRPKKVLDFRTPREVALNETVALAI